jgi:hypothetical protein
VIISLCSVDWLVFINEKERVYCAVRTGSLNIFQANASLYKVNLHPLSNLCIVVVDLTKLALR